MSSGNAGFSECVGDGVLAVVYCRRGGELKKNGMCCAVWQSAERNWSVEAHVLATLRLVW